MRSFFGKKGAICAACLFMGIICIIFPLRVRSAEENSIPQPSSAKVYSSMSDSSDVIANLIVGNVFEVIDAESDSDGGVWYKVKTDLGAEGYVKVDEMDRLIQETEALLASSAAAGNPVPTQETNAVQESEPTGENVTQNPEPAEENAAQNSEPAGEVSAIDNNETQAAEPESEENAEESGEETTSVEEESGTDIETMLESSIGQPAEGEAEPDFIDGAGLGKVTDDLVTDNDATGNEGFTVVEKTEKTKAHRHSGIDAVLILIIAGGILCIIAIAALLKRIMKFVRTGA